MATANWAGQVVNARLSLDQLAAKHPMRQFRIGRCGVAAFDALREGEDYASAERVVRLWRGRSADAARMEADLVRHARKKHAERCRNTQPGSAAADASEEQVIFVAVWPKSG